MNIKYFFKLSVANGFHGFIKRRYDLYCAVIIKYLSRYNTLFAVAYNNADVLV